MKLPTQAQNVNRANRVAEAKASGVNPAFWGEALNLLKKSRPGRAERRTELIDNGAWPYGRAPFLHNKKKYSDVIR
ncbi:hypothetical protein DZS_31690 [Dickeya ananatis]